jgi:hypothetical protein
MTSLLACCSVVGACCHFGYFNATGIGYLFVSQGFGGGDAGGGFGGQITERQSEK